eukprot:CAMPEP_0172648054 /NCGR_PEP_ID=MMETSP1068-20121228/241070_1 /TAXON_ID=35684 /ORGANISM="Pseudopedinella elastica, Strain CCMP716" /LENGTH=411 /DNA_ID=CAMNT_0013462355 /DNA_START=528 /DNA_END=1767 /DNA_ORIENTATION=+
MDSIATLVNEKLSESAVMKAEQVKMKEQLSRFQSLVQSHEARIASLEKETQEQKELQERMEAQAQKEAQERKEARAQKEAQERKEAQAQKEAEVPRKRSDSPIEERSVSKPIQSHEARIASQETRLETLEREVQGQQTPQELTNEVLPFDESESKATDFIVGDRVEVMDDEDDEDWEAGTVAGFDDYGSPLVLKDGFSKAFVWYKVRYIQKDVGDSRTFLVEDEMTEFDMGDAEKSCCKWLGCLALATAAAVALPHGFGAVAIEASSSMAPRESRRTIALAPLENRRGSTPDPQRTAARPKAQSDGVWFVAEFDMGDAEKSCCKWLGCLALATAAAREEVGGGAENSRVGEPKPGSDDGMIPEGREAALAARLRRGRNGQGRSFARAGGAAHEARSGIGVRGSLIRSPRPF